MQQRIRKKYFSIGSITTSMLANSHWKYQYFIQAMNLLIHSITRIVNLPPRNRCPQSEPSSEYLSLETVNVFFSAGFKAGNYFAILFKLQFNNASSIEDRLEKRQYAI